MGIEPAALWRQHQFTFNGGANNWKSPVFPLYMWLQPYIIRDSRQPLSKLPPAKTQNEAITAHLPHRSVDRNLPVDPGRQCSRGGNDHLPGGLYRSAWRIPGQGPGDFYPRKGTKASGKGTAPGHGTIGRSGPVSGRSAPAYPGFFHRHVWIYHFDTTTSAGDDPSNNPGTGCAAQCFIPCRPDSRGSGSP